MSSKLLSAILFMVLIVANTDFQTYAQQSEENDDKKCPLDFADFLYPMNSILESVDSPVKIVGATAGARDGVMLAGVDLKNLSDKTITAVKFQWYLFRVNSGEKVEITKGETSSVDIKECRSEEICGVDYSIVWCKDIQKPLAKNDNSEGKLAVVAIVSELSYKDGSKWRQNK